MTNRWGRSFLACVVLAALMPATGLAERNALAAELDRKPVLTLAAAREIAAAAEAEARRNGWNVSIAVVNDAGRLLYFQRMDGASNQSADIAVAKARHAALYRRDTRFHQELLEKGNAVVLALPDSMPIEGGLPLRADATIVGGIGVSGVQAVQDGQVAKAGADLLSP